VHGEIATRLYFTMQMVFSDRYMQLVPIITTAKDEQFIQQVAVVHIHSAVIPAAGFVAERGHEVGLARLRHAVLCLSLAGNYDPAGPLRWQSATMER